MTVASRIAEHDRTAAVDNGLRRAEHVGQFLPVLSPDPFGFILANGSLKGRSFNRLRMKSELQPSLKGRSSSCAATARILQRATSVAEGRIVDKYDSFRGLFSRADKYLQIRAASQAAEELTIRRSLRRGTASQAAEILDLYQGTTLVVPLSAVKSKRFSR